MRAREFRADFEGVVDLGIELQVADQRLRAARCREGGGRHAVHDQDRRLERRAVEVEAARLVAARVAAIDQACWASPCTR